MNVGVMFFFLRALVGWKAECHSLGLKGEFQGYVFFFGF